MSVKEGFKQKNKKWLDLSKTHLTPASQAERWIKKIKKLHNFFYVFIIFIITKFGKKTLISGSFKKKIGESGSQKV